MSKLDTLAQILHDAYKDSSSTLLENDYDNFGKRFEMKREIVAKPGTNYIVYKYDSRDAIFPYFKPQGVTNLKKMCDYVIFVEERSHLFVFLIELKKGTESPKKQLDAGECFIKYIISTVERLGLELKISDETLHFRKIRVSESISKKITLKKELTIFESGIFEHNNPKIFHINEYLTY